MSRLAQGWKLLRWREFRLRPIRCPFCGPSVLVRLCRDDDAAVRCLRCAASSVHLAMGWALRRVRPSLSGAAVCEFSARGPMVAWLRRSAAAVACSEYFADAEPGAFRNGVRCEDMQRLTYADASFDLVTHTEVLEHVPDDRRALRECLRVLRPGGVMLFTVPIFAGDVTVERAALDADGAIRHLEPPLFHSDPLRGEGILAFRDYRRDILQRLREAGFVESALLEALPSSPWSTRRPVLLARKAMN
ncbi:MAG: class I SAM-dependent methyltransferase [Xanthomonadales bacterium]|nr:class I SAM-dependent methyltransferase [Xanthomonadales bacterium]